MTTRSGSDRRGPPPPRADDAGSDENARPPRRARGVAAHTVPIRHMIDPREGRIDCYRSGAPHRLPLAYNLRGIGNERPVYAVVASGGCLRTFRVR